MSIQTLADSRRGNSTGFSLIEVLIAVVVLSVGLLALASLQASLTRASVVAKQRTVALSTANKIMEEMKSFPVNASYKTFGNIAAGSLTTTSSEVGATFSASWAVSDLYRCAPDGAGVRQANCTTPEVTGAPVVAKRVDMKVIWRDAGNEEQMVELSDVISSVSPADTALSLDDGFSDREKPTVTINKSLVDDTPGVVPIATGTDAGSSSSNPVPTIVKRKGDQDLVSTSFEVLSYVGAEGKDRVAIRRMEYEISQCRCVLDSAADSATKITFDPAVWTGHGYAVQGAVLGKRRTGSVDTRYEQSPYCTACCRDHHDRSGASYVINPFDSSLSRTAGSGALAGDHAHMLDGGTQDVGAGGVYDEMCRLTRVDGIMRVAMDSNLVDNVAVPNDGYFYNFTAPNLLVSTSGPDSGRSLYSSYAGRVIDGYVALVKGVGGSYPESAPALADIKAMAATHRPTLRLKLTDPSPNYASLMDFTTAASRSYAARVLYIDFMTPNVIECLDENKDNMSQCNGFAALNVDDLVPFYGVNYSDLAQWTATKGRFSVSGSVRNEDIVTTSNCADLVAQPALKFKRGCVTAPSGAGNSLDAISARLNGGSYGPVDMWVPDYRSITDLFEVNKK